MLGLANNKAESAPKILKASAQLDGAVSSRVQRRRRSRLPSWREEATLGQEDPSLLFRRCLGTRGGRYSRLVGASGSQYWETLHLHLAQKKRRGVQVPRCPGVEVSRQVRRQVRRQVQAGAQAGARAGVRAYV